MFKMQSATVAHVIVFCFALTSCRAGDEFKPGTDVLPRLKFEAEGSISSKQDKTLTLSSSPGWTWALLPEEIDLKRYPRLTISVKTNSACAVYLELKDKKNGQENALVGKDLINNVWKMKLDLADTTGEYKDVVFDLTQNFRPDAKDRLAKVLVLSDPDGDIEIGSITFGEKVPQKP